MSSPDEIDAVRGVVLDIEGTTTPVSFVHDVLFPYARERLRGFLSAHESDAVMRDAFQLLAAEWDGDAEAKVQIPRVARDDRSGARDDRSGARDDRSGARDDRSGARDDHDFEAIGDYLEWLMDRDRKSTGLKIIQGEIWRGGFESGALRGDVYADVPPALERWRAAGRTVVIYSSGSVAAQRLLFGHSTRGDLTPLIDAYFDTTVGSKRSAESYAAIGRSLSIPAHSLLFISDADAELVAAQAAGMRTRLCVREGTAPPTPFEIVHSFEEL